MKAPELDSTDRTPIWDAMQMLYMDTEVSDYYQSIANTCKQSKYSVSELELILFNEVLPAMRANLMQTIPEWRGFETEGLVNRVLAKHRYGRRKPWLFRRQTSSHWRIIKSLISAAD